MRLCEKTFLLSCKLDFYQLELKLSKLPLLLSHFLFTTKSLNHSLGQTRMRDAESDRLLLSFGVETHCRVVSACLACSQFSAIPIDFRAMICSKIKSVAPAKSRREFSVVWPTLEGCI